MEFKDYYATLGVSKTATGKEIKQAFRKLARRHHPDVNPGDKAAERRFKEFSEAYEVLADPDKRRKYDELGANWRMYEQAQQTGAGPFSGPGGGSWRVDFGGGPGGFRTMTEEEARDLFGNEDPFSDFFKTFFGGGGPRGRGQGRTGRTGGPRGGRDLEEKLELTLEEASRGVTRRLSIRTDGHARTVDVRIPAGVREGSRVRVAGEGGPGVGGGPAGDLFLRVRLRQDPRFERDGQDLKTHATVPLTTAVLGGEVEVPTIGGGTLRLRIPPTTQQGQVFRLRGQGMPALGKPSDRGDLYVTADVQLPQSLTAEERQHFEALAGLTRHGKHATT